MRRFTLFLTTAFPTFRLDERPIRDAPVAAGPWKRMKPEVTTFDPLS
jgi:hypothetical protein